MKAGDNETVQDWSSKAAQDSFLANNPEFKAQKAEITRLNNALLKVKAGTQIIVNAIKEAYVEPPNLYVPSPPPKSRKTNEEIAVLHISDTQLGKVTPTYNSTVAKDRITDLVFKTVQITNMRRSNAAINAIHVYLGGDMVEGEDIFPGQAHEIDQPVFEQSCKTAPEVFCNAILYLLEHFPTVKVCAVPGNHGRNGRKGTNSSTKTNWDMVCYEVMYWMLNASEFAKKNNLSKRLTFDIPEDDFFVVDPVFDWGNLIVHGQQITGGFAGFPWYGAAKKAWGWIDAIDAPWDYLWFGHFHTYASAVLNKRVFLANGTTESSNNYAKEQLASGGYPCQRLAFFNPSHGLISDNQIYLDNTRTPQKTRLASWQ